MIQDNRDLRWKATVKLIVFAGFILLVIIRFPDVISILKKIYGAFSPLLIGSALAFVLNILVEEYEKRYFPNSTHRNVQRTRRGISILLSILTIIVILIFFLYILIPQITQLVRLLVIGFPGLYDKVVSWLIEQADKVPGLQERLSNLDMSGEAVVNKVLEVLGNWSFGTFTFIGTIFSKIVTFILAMTVSIYILAGKEDLKEKFDRFFSAYIAKDRKEKLYDGMRTANETFASYILGQCKEAIVLGTLCTAGMLVFRFPYPTIIGPVIGLTALIPMVGSFIGAGIGFLLIIAISPIKATLFILFIVVLQQIDNNFIYPRVVGQSIGIPGIWVLAAIIIGGGLLGMAGVLLGVPMFATFYKLLGKSINEKLKASTQQKGDVIKTEAVVKKDTI